MRKKLKQQHKTYLKMFSIMLLAAIITVIAAQAGFCDPPTVADQVPAAAATTANAVQTAEQSKSDAIVKFLIAMGGVALSSIVIFLGLTIYNKFFVDKKLFEPNNPDDALNTPETVEEAVTLYIKRNKLC